MAHILVVDDAASVRNMVRNTLAEAGHEVTTACDGVEGIKATTRARFDAIVTDVNMPEMDGIQMTQILRSRHTYAQTPILMLTTEGRAAVIKQGKRAGATGWIVKPFNGDKLVAAIERLLAMDAPRRGGRLRQAG